MAGFFFIEEAGFCFIDRKRARMARIVAFFDVLVKG